MSNEAKMRALLAEVFQLLQGAERHEGSPLAKEPGQTIRYMQLPMRLERDIGVLLAATETES